MSYLSPKLCAASVLSFLCTFGTIVPAEAQQIDPQLRYEISVPEPEDHTYHVSMQIKGWKKGAITLKMPRWMPGYYQYLKYGEDVRNLKITCANGEVITPQIEDGHIWKADNISDGDLTISYDIQTSRSFVATSYVDKSRAYIAPTNTFLYVEELLDEPVAVKVQKSKKWKDIATGLLPQEEGLFVAEDFDRLYDSPILIGNLDHLQSFEVGGINHRFMGYELGEFDEAAFIESLKKMVTAASDLIGEIPYREYTFIGIGPGRGGIEHLNNTTVSFDGSSLTATESRLGMLNFLAHEYFHHYNVKRIRPVELGPFDYENGSKTNQLWISEGLTVYYEYIINRRAGILSEKEFLNQFIHLINTVENDQGKWHQSLAEASYYTWEDGPFGTAKTGEDRSISVYDKGAVVGLLLDFRIRFASGNQRSLDDVMRFVYRKYYKELGRGFSDAEFQTACELMAGEPLADIFRYIDTTEPLDYEAILPMGGLKVTKTIDENGALTYTLAKEPTGDLESQILRSWIRVDQ